MIQLLYRSIARDDEFSESDLDILVTALEFNRANGITGFLWRARGQFFQALHGPADAVGALMARIAADQRHHGLEVLFEEPAPGPTPFSDWAMGYDYIAEDLLGLSLSASGERPVLGREQAAEIWQAMVEQAQSQAKWGNHFPYARKIGETIPAWQERLAIARRNPAGPF